MSLKVSRDKVQLFLYFIFVSIVGSVLLSLPIAYKTGIPAPIIDALFISVSAICVTGLSTVNMDIFTPTGFIFIMALIELGGLGIISFISLYVIIPKKKVSLVNRSVIADFYIDDVEFDPRKILRNIIFFTLAIEIFGSCLLYPEFRESGSAHPVLDSTFHSVSAFCNAGFSTYNDSLASFHSNFLILGTVMFLIVSGGIGFIVLTDIRERILSKKRRLSLHSRLALGITAVLIIGGASICFALEQDSSMKGLPLGEKIMASLFHAITPRTAGFEVVPEKNLSLLSKILTILLMFIGGSPGSIAGGIKTTTFFIVFVYAIRGNTERNGLNVFRRNIDTRVVEKAFSIVAKGIMIVLASLMCLIVTESARISSGSCTVLDLLFEVVSAFGTVGLSLGVTPTLSFAGKVVIICTMFIGRTGIFAMALGSSRNARERFYEYPSANIMVG